MKPKATLPLLLLLLVFGQISAELCMARCESMATMAPSCRTQRMAQDHCAMCNHASAVVAGSVLLAQDTGSGKLCNSVLGLLPNRTEKGMQPWVAAVSSVLVTLPALEDIRPVRYRTTRSTESTPQFDPLISSLRI